MGAGYPSRPDGSSVGSCDGKSVVSELNRLAASFEARGKATRDTKTAPAGEASGHWRLCKCLRFNPGEIRKLRHVTTVEPESSQKTLESMPTARSMAYRAAVLRRFNDLAAKMTGNVRKCPTLQKDRRSRKPVKSPVLITYVSQEPANLAKTPMQGAA
jgi:hypothetical protein